MKTLGFEVANYADLERQYVPLAKGVSILAGKNNVGKSAILLAMSFSAQLAPKYAGTESRLNLICEPQESDGPFIDELPTGRLLALTPDSWIRLELKFGSPTPGILAAYLNSSLLPRESGIYTVGNPQRAVLQPNGQPRRYLAASEFNSVIQEATRLFNNAIYIAPHRVVQPTMPMSEQKRLPSTGAELAAYLMDIRGREQTVFEQVQDAYLDMFPEFSSINTPMSGTNVSIELQLRSGGRRPLSSCGTGLEQMLVLLTNVICASKGQLMLLDEPHNFLFPSVERKFLKVLSSLRDKYFIIATHSAISINSVPPDRITYIERPGSSYSEQRSRSQGTGIPQILHELGYRNSDLLFHDKLIFVEGPSDSELLLGLLRRAHDEQSFPLDDSVGCPDLGGAADYRKAEDIQQDVLREEKLISSIGRTAIPHAYLFDGDKAVHREVLDRTRAHGTNPINFAFLKRYELENYFLIAPSITKALNRELSASEVGLEVTEEEIRAEILRWTDSDPDLPLTQQERTKFFPKDLPGQNESKVKGSRVLEKIYASRNIPYHKSKSGKLVLEFLELTEEMKRELQETTREIVDLLRPRAGDAATGA